MSLALDRKPDTRLDRADPGPFHARNARPRYSIRPWACVYTHPQAEAWAQTNLQRAGYETLLPLMRVRRRDRVVRSLWHIVERPLFSRYLFVRFDHTEASWSPIRAAPGVRDILRDRDKVLYAPEAVVSALQAVRELDGADDRWRVGMPCSLATGPLRGMEAVVTKVHGNTAAIGVIMLGCIRQISVPLDCLTARDCL